MLDSEFTRAAFAAIGALVFTITAVGAAVAPARLAETASVVYADAAPQSESGIDA
jgi:hypothetical protein